MQLRHLRYFIAVVDTGSVSAASRLLRIAQPALSTRITELEQELGFRLLTRGPAGSAVTSAGEAFAVEVRHILGRLEAAQAEAARIADSSREPLRVGVVRSASHLEFIHRAFRDFANLGTECQVNRLAMNAGQLTAAFERGDLDLMITYEEVANLDAAAVTPIHVEQLVVAIPSDEPMARKQEIDITDLAAAPLVLSPRASYPRLYDSLMAAFANVRSTPHLAGYADSDETFEMVRSGVACTVVASSTALRPDFQNVVLRPVSDMLLPVRLVLAWHPQSPGAALLARTFQGRIRDHQRALDCSGLDYAYGIEHPMAQRWDRARTAWINRPVANAAAARQ